MADFWQEAIDTIDSSLEGDRSPLTIRSLLGLGALPAIYIADFIGRPSRAEPYLFMLMIGGMIALPALYLWRTAVVRRRVRETGSPFKQRDIM